MGRRPAGPAGLALVLGFTAAASPPAPLVPFRPLTPADFRFQPFRALPFGGMNVTWAFTVSCCNTTKFFSSAAVEAASRKHRLLTRGLECVNPDGETVQGTRIGAISEWGNEFESFSCSGPPEGRHCCELGLANRKDKPANRLEALDMMDAYFNCRSNISRGEAGAAPNSPVVELTGYALFAAFAARLGTVSMVVVEVMENIFGTQAHFAFTRGAGRQYGLPWAVDGSPWMGGFITDYSTARPWGAASSAGGDGGHSVSLSFRIWMTAYSSGASQVIAEAGGVNLFFENVSASDGVLNLSPMGEAAQNFSAFVAGQTERATPYVPFALVMEHAHGFGLSTAGFTPNPESWGLFPLSPSEEVGWTLLEELWPTSCRLDGVEGNYLVPGPCGDTWDVLAEPNFTKSLAGYRVVALGGEVQLVQPQLAELSQWVREGGVVLAFASQLRAIDHHVEFVGIGLGDSGSVRISNVTDEETHWSNQPDHHSNQRPFCVAQDGSAAFYIKTGGNPAVRSGWDNGKNDKCCTSAPNTCRWYPTLQACTAALATVTCLPCASCNGTGSPLACPQWIECGASQTSTLYATTGSMGPNTSVLLSAGVTSTNNESQILPAVLRNDIGAGSVLTVLLEDADALRSGSAPRTGVPGYGVFSHLLKRMADIVLPIDLLDVATGTIDMKAKLQVLLGRSKAGWHVTLINNGGVTKHPSSAVKIDATKAVSTVLKMKPGYGVVGSATLATDAARRQMPVIDEGVRVTVPPGGVAVVELRLK